MQLERNLLKSWFLLLFTIKLLKLNVNKNINLLKKMLRKKHVQIRIKQSQHARL